MPRFQWKAGKARHGFGTEDSTNRCLPSDGNWTRTWTSASVKPWLSLQNAPKWHGSSESQINILTITRVRVLANRFPSVVLFWQKIMILKHVPGFVSFLYGTVPVWWWPSLNLARRGHWWQSLVQNKLGTPQNVENVECRSMIDARSRVQLDACPLLAFYCSNPDADIHTRSYEYTHDTNGMHVDALWVSKCLQRSGVLCLLNLRRLTANGCEWNKDGI